MLREGMTQHCQQMNNVLQFCIFKWLTSKSLAYRKKIMENYWGQLLYTAWQLMHNLLLEAIAKDW